MDALVKSNGKKLHKRCLLEKRAHTRMHESPLKSNNSFYHAALCGRPVSVTLSVCHTPVLYRNDWTNQAGFWHEGFLPENIHRATVNMNATQHQRICSLRRINCLSETRRNSSLIYTIRYDTIRDAILTCARKQTRVSLIYRLLHCLPETVD